MKSWALRRQAVGIGVFSLVVLVLAGSLVYYLIPKHSCTDSIKNGSEEGVDCGGSCPNSCLGENPKAPVQLWARFFPVRGNKYDAGAYVENLNLRLVGKNVRYTFRLYDASRVLIDKREGTTYLYPGEKTFIFEPNLDAGKQQPAWVDFSIDSIEWERFEPEDTLTIGIVSRTFTTDPYPGAEVVLANRSLFEEPALEVVVLLERSGGTVYAASRTIVERFDPGTQKTVSFIWPETPLEEPANITVLYRRVLE